MKSRYKPESCAFQSKKSELVLKPKLVLIRGISKMSSKITHQDNCSMLKPFLKENTTKFFNEFQATKITET